LLQSGLGLAALLLIGLVIGIVALTWYTVYLLTHPLRRTYASALARGRPGDPGELLRPQGDRREYESWTLHWRGGELPVWDVRGDSPGGPVVILSHGWGDSRVGGLSRAGVLLPMCSRLLLWDMPGHGEAPGVCTLGTREVGALVSLIERVGGSGPVVLLGWSLGAGVSVAAAARLQEECGRGVAAVIAEAPYRFPWTPARNVLRGFGLPWRVNLPPAMWGLGMRFGGGAGWPGFDREKLARNLPCPLLVIHGEGDEVCPVEDGREIAAAAPQGGLCIVPGAGHHGLWTEAKSTAVCVGAVQRLFSSLRGVTPSPGDNAGQRSPQPN